MVPNNKLRDPADVCVQTHLGAPTPAKLYIVEHPSNLPCHPPVTSTHIQGWDTLRRVMARKGGPAGLGQWAECNPSKGPSVSTPGNTENPGTSPQGHVHTHSHSS